MAQIALGSGESSLLKVIKLYLPYFPAGPSPLNPLSADAPVINVTTWDIGPFTLYSTLPLNITFIFPRAGTSSPYNAFNASCVDLKAPATAGHECPANFTASAYVKIKRSEEHTSELQSQSNLV